MFYIAFCSTRGHRSARVPDIQLPTGRPLLPEGEFEDFIEDDLDGIYTCRVFVWG